MTRDEWLQSLGLSQYNDYDSNRTWWGFANPESRNYRDIGLREGFDDAMNRSYTSLTTPNAQGRLPYGTNISGIGGDTAFDVMGYAGTGTDGWMRTGQDVFANLGGGTPYWQEASRYLQTLNPQEVQRYSDEFGYELRPDVSAKLNEINRKYNGNMGGFFSADGPFSAFGQTIGPALGLSAAINYLGNFGHQFLPNLGGGGGESWGVNPRNMSTFDLFGDIYNGVMDGAIPSLDSTSSLFGNLYNGVMDGTIPSLNSTYDLFGDIYNTYGVPPAIDPGSWTGEARTGATPEAPAVRGFGSTAGPLGQLGQAFRQLLGGGGGGGSGGGLDLLRLLGGLGGAGLGYLGAQAQTDAFERMQDRYLSLGQPHRDRLNASYQPGFSMSNEPGYADALDQASQSVLRKLSVDSGNPFDQPNSMTSALDYVTKGTALPALQNYRSQLGSFGQLGTNTAGTAGLGAAQSAGGTYDALGYGLNQVLNPDSSLESLLRTLGDRNFRLSSGWGT